MKVVIPACTNEAFSYGLMPPVHLNLRPPIAVNDNNALFSPPRRVRPADGKGAAYGRAAFIIAVLAVVAGIIVLILLHGLVDPAITASEERPGILRSSPTAPTLLQLQGEWVRWPSGTVRRLLYQSSSRKKPRRDWSERG
jgi:hypothetical protein